MKDGENKLATTALRYSNEKTFRQTDRPALLVGMQGFVRGFITNKEVGYPRAARRTDRDIESWRLVDVKAGAKVQLFEAEGGKIDLSQSPESPEGEFTTLRLLNPNSLVEDRGIQTAIATCLRLDGMCDDNTDSSSASEASQALGDELRSLDSQGGSRLDDFIEASDESGEDEGVSVRSRANAAEEEDSELVGECKVLEQRCKDAEIVLMNAQDNFGELTAVSLAIESEVEEAVLKQKRAVEIFHKACAECAHNSQKLELLEASKASNELDFKSLLMNGQTGEQHQASVNTQCLALWASVRAVNAQRDLLGQLDHDREAFKQEAQQAQKVVDASRARQAVHETSMKKATAVVRVAWQVRSVAEKARKDVAAQIDVIRGAPIPKKRHVHHLAVRAAQYSWENAEEWLGRPVGMHPPGRRGCCSV